VGARPPRRARWLLAGGLAGLALSGPVARVAHALHDLGRRTAGPLHADPVAPFLQAPCERGEPVAAAADAAREPR
jgi:hypothetical protein